MNLAMSLAVNSFGQGPLKVGLLDLDIFGPSIPKLMGLDNAPEPALTRGLFRSLSRKTTDRGTNIDVFPCFLLTPSRLGT